MTKPWEESWTPDEEAVGDGDYVAIDADGYAVITAYSRDDVGDPDKTAEGRLRLASAAPDMARALLTLRPAHGAACSCEPCLTVTAALQKAGVLR
jgi:hypothetical protein